MNKTKIPTFDYTWNPVVGCWGPGGTQEKPNWCSYCYAKGIANRFAGDSEYKKRFWPTFWEHRLGEPAKVKKPSSVFVCSMADLFGDWVSSDTINAVIDAAEKAPQHTYFFLTKNPGRYQEFEWPGNHWLGTTVTGRKDADRSQTLFINHDGKNKIWVSAEPIMGELYSALYPNDWLILGAMTGRLAKKYPQDLDHLERVVRDWTDYIETPLYMKPSLADIWPGELIQEMPEVGGE